MKPCAAAPRWPFRCGVLSRTDSSGYRSGRAGKKSVGASASRSLGAASAPRRRSVILNRVRMGGADRGLGGVRPGALLVVLVAASAGLRFWAASRIPSPWITPDEQTYAELGR